jgi:hypothetical protein
MLLIPNPNVDVPRKFIVPVITVIVPTGILNRFIKVPILLQI